MNEFNVIQKVFIKSNNSTKKINLNYTYSLIFITIITILLSLVFDYQEEAILLIKNFFLIITAMSILTYIINIIKKKYSPKLIYENNNLLSLSLIISLFSKNTPYYIIIFATILTIIIKNLSQERNLSSSLYGILFLIIYNTTFTNHIYITIDNYKIIDYLINPNYVSPILSILAFIYLFYKKSIKYNITFAYLLTYTLVIFLYTILNKTNPSYILTSLIINSFLFLSIYVLPDYKITPTISEGQIIYGIIAGLITAILYFFIPNLSVVITLIVSPLIFTKFIEKNSPKLKYNNKTYHLSITICLILIIITTTTLVLVF